jgi:hypothetical protein
MKKVNKNCDINHSILKIFVTYMPYCIFSARGGGWGYVRIKPEFTALTHSRSSVLTPFIACVEEVMGGATGIRIARYSLLLLLQFEDKQR